MEEEIKVNEPIKVGDYVIVGKDIHPFYKGQEVLVKHIYEDGTADVEAISEPLLVADKISLDEIQKIV